MKSQKRKQEEESEYIIYNNWDKIKDWLKKILKSKKMRVEN